MTDTETLLRKAAMAAGYKPIRMSDDGRGLLLEGVQEPWNSVDNSGDALDLAVTLEIQAGYSEFSGEGVAMWHRGSRMVREYGPDNPRATTRLAITRAAAAIYDSRQGAAA